MRSIILLLTVCVSLSAQTFVQYTACTSGATCTAFGSNNTDTNTIIIGIVRNAATIAATATDTRGNTYTSVVKSENIEAEGVSLQYLVADNIAAGANTITIANCTSCDAAAVEVSGLAASAFDQSSFNRDTATTSHTSGNTATTAFANEYVLGFTACNGATLSVGSGFTSRGTPTDDLVNIVQDKVVTATGVQASPVTSSVNRTCNNAVATFKATSQPGGVRRRALIAKVQ